MNCKPRVPIETYSQPFPCRFCNLSCESTIIDFDARLCNLQRIFCFTTVDSQELKSHVFFYSEDRMKISRLKYLVTNISGTNVQGTKLLCAYSFPNKHNITIYTLMHNKCGRHVIRIGICYVSNWRILEYSRNLSPSFFKTSKTETATQGRDSWFQISDF